MPDGSDAPAAAAAARPLVALDTSAAVPLVMRRHQAHKLVREAVHGRLPVLTFHSQIETYAVLTRLPGDARVSPADAARVLAANFGPPLQLRLSGDDLLPVLLASADVAGGATYDAVVALTAMRAGVLLLTRDARAMNTYQRIGVHFQVVG